MKLGRRALVLMVGMDLSGCDPEVECGHCKLVRVPGISFKYIMMYNGTY